MKPQIEDLNQFPRDKDIANKIYETLTKLKPLECDLAGKSIMKAISSGKQFKTIEGGRHLDLSDLVSNLASIATLIDISIRIVLWSIKKLKNSKESPKIKDVKLFIIEEIEKEEKLRLLVKNEPDLINQIIESLSKDKLNKNILEKNDNS